MWFMSIEAWTTCGDFRHYLDVLAWYMGVVLVAADTVERQYRFGVLSRTQRSQYDTGRASLAHIVWRGSFDLVVPG